MDIKYGKKITEVTYINSVPKERNYIEIRDQVSSDAEELKLFIRFQKDSKNSIFAEFKREKSKSSAGNTNHYVIRRYEI